MRNQRENSSRRGLRGGRQRKARLKEELWQRGKFENYKPQEDLLAAKAFRLFEEGKGPIDAVMELNMAPDAAIENYDKWIQMKQRDLSKPSVPAKLEQYKKILDNVISEVVFVQELALARPGLLECPKCGKGKLVSEYGKPDGFVLTCPLCGFKFGPYDPGDLKPFFLELYCEGDYERTEQSFARFGIETEEEL